MFSDVAGTSRPEAHRRKLQGSRAAQMIFDVANEEIVLAVVHLSKKRPRRSAQQAVDHRQAAPTARSPVSAMRMGNSIADCLQGGRCTAAGGLQLCMHGPPLRAARLLMLPQHVYTHPAQTKPQHALMHAEDFRYLCAMPTSRRCTPWLAQRSAIASRPGSSASQPSIPKRWRTRHIGVSATRCAACDGMLRSAVCKPWSAGNALPESAQTCRCAAARAGCPAAALRAANAVRAPPLPAPATPARPCADRGT